nr:galanin receptor 2b-like [Lytechinus pictus]
MLTASTNGTSSPTWSWDAIDWGDWYTLLQLVPACLGCLGNLVVMAILFPRKSQNRSTDTLIGHLAVADFLTSVFLLPIPSVRNVPQNWAGFLYCGFIHTKSCRLVCIFSSIYILVVICCDRYVAVVYPLQFNRWLTRGRCTLSIALTWLVSSVGQFTATFTTLDISKSVCRLSSGYYSRVIGGSLNFFFVFALPALVMLTLQLIVAHKLLRKSRRFNSAMNGPSGIPSFHLVARRKVLKMTAIVVAIFVTTVGPNQISYYCYNVGMLPREYLSGEFHRFTFLLACYNSCANPFIYASQNKKFREAFLNMWPIWKRPKSRDLPIF